MPFLTLADLQGDALVLHARGLTLDTLPAVVVQTDAPPPGAVPLGGPYWRVATDHPLATARALVAAGAVDAFPDVVHHVRRTAAYDDPSYGGQWYLQDLDMEALYAISPGSPDTKVGVADSGIEITNTDLVDKVLDPYDAVDDDDDPSPNPGEYCTDGSTTEICDEHGTATSGITLAEGGNDFGIVGMCPDCTLVPVKLLGESDSSLSTETSAFQHLFDADVAVVNNSWGYTEYTPAPQMLSNLIETLSTETRGGLGTVVVFAAGNDDRELKDDEVEALPGVLCVSATDTYGNPTGYTNYGGPIDVAAPSATVTIAPGDTVIENFGGTSAAAPVVTGLAAWILSVHPELSAAEVTDLITSTAVMSPLVIPDDDGHSDYYGYGNINPDNVVAALYGSGDTGDTGGEEPGGCGCATSGSGVGWVGLGVAGVALLRRRRH